MSTLRFRTLCDYGDGNLMLVGKSQHNGDFRWWPVIRLRDMRNYMSEWEMEQDRVPTYSVELLAVSPEEAGREGIERAFSCCGIEQDAAEADPLVCVEALAEYGIFAVLWSAEGNNRRDLLREARREAALASMLFGFYMDRPQNRIGSSGWDCIRGDLTAGLYR